MKRSKLNNTNKDPQGKLNITSIVLRTAFLDGSIYKSINEQPKVLLLAFILVCITGIGFGGGGVGAEVGHQTRGINYGDEVTHPGMVAAIVVQG